MTHYTSARFWRCYRALPSDVQALADRNYALLKANPKHRSLQFKQAGVLWSVRVGLHYRTLATGIDDDIVWIGSHAEYDKLVGRHSAAKASQPTNRGMKKDQPKDRGRATRR